MVQMDLPQLNVLTKIDNLSNYGSLPFNLDYYAEVQDLSYLLPHLAQECPMFGDSKFEGLNKAVIELVDNFGLVSFETVAVEDKQSMIKLLQAIDRASGYVFGGPEGANDTIWQVAMREGLTTMDIRDVQERWLDAKDEHDQHQRTQLMAESQLRARDAHGVADDLLDRDVGDVKKIFKETPISSSSSSSSSRFPSHQVVDGITLIRKPSSTRPST